MQRIDSRLVLVVFIAVFGLYVASTCSTATTTPTEPTMPASFGGGPDVVARNLCAASPMLCARTTPTQSAANASGISTPASTTPATPTASATPSVTASATPITPVLIVLGKRTNNGVYTPEGLFIDDGSEACIEVGLLIGAMGKRSACFPTFLVTGSETGIRFEPAATCYDQAVVNFPVPEVCNSVFARWVGTRVIDGDEPRLTPSTDATAICIDLTLSFSQARSGTCSHHGGVARWLN